MTIIVISTTHFEFGLPIPVCWFPYNDLGTRLQYQFHCFNISFISLALVRYGMFYVPVGLIILIGGAMLLAIFIKLIKVLSYLLIIQLLIVVIDVCYYK